MVYSLRSRARFSSQVVMLGYEKQMRKMLTNSNPGLARRMRLESAFRFEDFDDAALLRILRDKAAKAGLPVDVGTARHAVAVLAKAKAEPNFGNAGAVDNLLTDAKLAMRRRLDSLPPQAERPVQQLLPEDFGEDPRKGGSGGEEAIFSGLVGCDNITEKLKEYRAVIQLAQRRGDDPRDKVNYNFLFVGSPGEILEAASRIRRHASYKLLRVSFAPAHNAPLRACSVSRCRPRDRQDHHCSPHGTDVQIAWSAAL